MQDWTFSSLKSVKMKDFNININNCREEGAVLQFVCIIEAGFQISFF